MNLNNTRVINADCATVWAAILDPEVLKACVPGCQQMEGTPEDAVSYTHLTLPTKA